MNYTFAKNAISAQEIFDQLSKDLVTCTECLLVLHPLINGRGAEVLNGKPLANVTLRVRDAVIHEAVLSLTRILEKKHKDRLCIEELISVHKKSVRGAAYRMLNDIHASEDWSDLENIRNGRLGHNLTDRGPDLSWNHIKNVRDKLVPLFILLCSDEKFQYKLDVHKKFWNSATRQFWDAIFLEASSNS